MTDDDAAASVHGGESDQAEAEDDAAIVGDAREKVKALLEALAIDEVVIVDDYYFPGQASAAEISEAMASSDALFSAVADRLSVTADHLGFADVDEDDRNQVADYLVENWARLPQDVQLDLTALLRTQQQDDAEGVDEEQIRDDLSASEALQQVIGDAVDFSPMSMTEWNSTWRTHIQNDRRYLVLIDRTLTREVGGGEDSGIDLLEELLRESHPGVFAGLFTRRAPDEEGEQVMTTELQARMQDQAHRLVVLGKFRARSVGTLPAGLRTILLAAEVAEYRTLAGAALDAGNAAAKERLRQLNNYQLVEAFAAAQNEGIFELDHPIRIALQTQAGVVARHLRGSDYPESSLKALRTGTISAFRNAARDETQVRLMLREDRFEIDGLENELGLPLEVGDVFLVESLLPSKKGMTAPLPQHFILLGQACDLTLRSRGAREPHVPHLVLHALSDADGADQTRHPVGYFDASTDRTWNVRFKETLMVPIDALDATVFNKDGRAVIDLSYSETRPMAQGWPVRLGALQGKAKAALETIGRAESELKSTKGKEEWLRHLVASLTGGATGTRGGVTVRADSRLGQLEYGIRRVGRVRHDTAARLADAASAFQGRPAFEADIAIPTRESAEEE